MSRLHELCFRALHQFFYFCNELVLSLVRPLQCVKGHRRGPSKMYYFKFVLIFLWQSMTQYECYSGNSLLMSHSSAIQNIFSCGVMYAIFIPSLFNLQPCMNSPQKTTCNRNHVGPQWKIGFFLAPSDFCLCCRDQSQTSCVVCSPCCRPASYRLNFLFC